MWISGTKRLDHWLHCFEAIDVLKSVSGQNSVQRKCQMKVSHCLAKSAFGGGIKSLSEVGSKGFHTRHALSSDVTKAMQIQKVRRYSSFRILYVVSHDFPATIFRNLYVGKISQSAVPHFNPTRLCLSKMGVALWTLILNLILI